MRGNTTWLPLAAAGCAGGGVRSSPDLVILDLGLPDMDGVDVIRSLRKWTQVPIVILSGRMNSAAKVDALMQAPMTTSQNRSAWRNSWPEFEL